MAPGFFAKPRAPGPKSATFGHEKPGPEPKNPRPFIDSGGAVGPITKTQPVGSRGEPWTMAGGFPGYASKPKPVGGEFRSGRRLRGPATSIVVCLNHHRTTPISPVFGVWVNPQQRTG